MNGDYRRPDIAANLQRQYETLRKNHESSTQMARWRRSGQGNPNFYPGFCDNNPVSVFLFYIFADDNEAGESDLQLCVESM